jgi:hypothetical protein
MRCYQHHEREAVGICRGCGKGVCDEGCATDLGYGLSCSDECSRRIGHVDALNRKASAAYSLTRRNTWIAPSFFLVFGAIFIYFGWQDHREPFNLATMMGGLFIVFALVVLLRGRRWAKAVR